MHSAGLPPRKRLECKDESAMATWFRELGPFFATSVEADFQRVARQFVNALERDAMNFRANGNRAVNRATVQLHRPSLGVHIVIVAAMMAKIANEYGAAGRDNLRYTEWLHDLRT
jgi:hypothetical protein